MILVLEINFHNFQHKYLKYCFTFIIQAQERVRVLVNRPLCIDIFMIYFEYHYGFHHGVEK